MANHQASPIRLFSTDLDGTILGNPESANRFKLAWEALDKDKRPLLVFNTGRSVRDESSRSTNVYISLVTMSVSAPTPRAKSCVSSKIGVRISW